MSTEPTALPGPSDTGAGHCPCGQSLHYTSPLTQAAVEGLVAAAGPTARIITPAGTWMVPRHYVALHEIKADQLPELADRYGFARVFRCPRCGRVSHHPEDLRYGYCGACHEFTGSSPA